MRLLVVLVLLTSLLSENTSQVFSDLKFSQGLTREDGLGHNHVECIFQDSYGFIWFGTRYGLTRYDGYDLITYRANSNQGSISGNWILSINEDYEGHLWVGTFHNGVNRFSRETGKFQNFLENPELGERINKITVLSDSSVWLSTSNGLARYIPDSNIFKVFLPEDGNPHSLNSPHVFDMIQTSNGKCYVAAWHHQIQEFNPLNGLFESISYQRSQDLLIDWKKKIVEDFDGNLWISAYQHGLCRYNPANGESSLFTRTPGELSTNILNGDMMVDQNGDVWISTDGDGINIFHTETGKFSYLNSRPGVKGSIPSNQVYAFHLDDQNQIWIGFYDKGTILYNPASARFENMLFNPGDLNILKDKSILTVFQDSRQQVWIGTDGDGLYRFDVEKESSFFKHNASDPFSLTSNVITSIAETPQGNLLVGTYAAGLNIINKDNYKIERISPKASSPLDLRSSSIWEMFKDSQGKIWLGMLGSGVVLYDPDLDSFIDYGPDSDNLNRIEYNNIMVIMEDSDGDIWFGTEGEGVRILDRETEKTTMLSSQLENPTLDNSLVKSLMQDRMGHIWIGTEGDGLFIYNKHSGEVKQITISDGLPDMIIQGIKEDSRGNVWITTGNGMALLNPETRRIVNFYRSDGLSASEFNGDAVIQLRDGRILVGSINGADVFDPEKILLNQNLPRVMITGLEILNEEVFAGDTVNGRVVLEKNIAYTDDMNIIYRDKIYTLLFTALNFSQPEKCRFQYKLEGFDNDWIETSSERRYATYSYLRQGTYTFKVRASNNDGKWGNNIRELKINVSPPFWLTWWFIGGLTILLSGMIFLLYRTRITFYKNKFLQKETLQEKRIIELEKESLEGELGRLTFFRLNRNRNLLELKMRLSGLSVKASESVKPGLKQIIKEIDLEINSDKDWKLLEPQVDRTYNNFLTSLREKHPDLSLSELKISAYVRMNLTTKEMAEFMHKTVRAIENDRYRLRKKLCLDSNDSLKDYLMNI